MTEPNGLNNKMQQWLDEFSSSDGTFLTTMNTIIGQLTGISSALFTGVTYLAEINTRLDTVLAAIGNVTGLPEDTILALLHSIQGNTETNCNQRAPDPTDPMGCASPLVSTGMVAATDYGGRTFAIWNIAELPEGLTEGSFLTHDVANAQLVHDAAGIWLAYVLSCSSDTFSISPDLDTLYPTGQWVDVSANLDMAFNVPTAGDIQVYLCVPSDAVWTDCVDIDSISTTYTTNQPFALECQAIVFSSIPGDHCADSMTSAGDFTEGLSDPCGVLVGDLSEVTITLLTTGPTVRVEWVVSGARDGVNLVLPSAASIDIPSGAVSLLVANVGTGLPESEPFSITVCPSGGV